jgi:hypothetical protein
MKFGTDGKGQVFVEWNRGAAGTNGWARAWISRRDGEKDWAGTGRYLNATRVDAPGGGPSGTGPDFPISSSLSDQEILRAYVVTVSAITGNSLDV